MGISIIIDEAHKLVQAAQSMYGEELPNTAAPKVLTTVDELTFKRGGFKALARKLAKKLSNESARLFKQLKLDCNFEDEDIDEADCFTANIEHDAGRHLKNIRNISEQLLLTLRDEVFFIKVEGLLKWIREKYGASTQKINLKKILDDTSGDQSKRMLNQLAPSETIVVRFVPNFFVHVTSGKLRISVDI